MSEYAWTIHEDPTVDEHIGAMLSAWGRYPGKDAIRGYKYACRKIPLRYLVEACKALTAKATGDQKFPLAGDLCRVARDLMPPSPMPDGRMPATPEERRRCAEMFPLVMGILDGSALHPGETRAEAVARIVGRSEEIHRKLEDDKARYRVAANLGVSHG